MLRHLLAELIEHLFAVAPLVEHIEAAINLAIHADRFAKDHKISTLNQRQDGDKYQDVNEWFN